MHCQHNNEMLCKLLYIILFKTMQQLIFLKCLEDFLWYVQLCSDIYIQTQSDTFKYIFYSDILYTDSKQTIFSTNKIIKIMIIISIMMFSVMLENPSAFKWLSVLKKNWIYNILSLWSLIPEVHCTFVSCCLLMCLPSCF